MEEKSEAILIYLSFNLARSHLKSILNSIHIILENYELNYQYLDLITRIEEASTMTLRKNGTFKLSFNPIDFIFFLIIILAKQIPVKLIKLNEITSNDKEVVESELILNEESTEIILQPKIENNQSKLNIKLIFHILYLLFLLI